MHGTLAFVSSAASPALGQRRSAVASHSRILAATTARSVRTDVSDKPAAPVAAAPAVVVSPAELQTHASGLDRAMLFLKALVDTLAPEALRTARAGDRNTTWEYAVYQDPLHPEAKLTLPKRASVLPQEQVILPARVGQIVQRNFEYMYSQAPLLDPATALEQEKPKDPSTPLLPVLPTPGLAAIAKTFLAPFRWWVQPPTTVVARWHKDEEIAAQHLRGCNPMKITRAKSADELPHELRVLREPATSGGRDTAQLAYDGDLFLCDYHELMCDGLNPDQGFYTHTVPGLPHKYWYAPVLTLNRRKSDGKLDILGFTLTRFTDRPNIVYSAATHASQPNLYALAKLHLTCADNQHHQFVSHLGMTHLLVEPFIIAMHNTLPRDHILSRMLMPFFRDTIGINVLGRDTLMASGNASFTDATFSVGTRNVLNIFSAAYREYDFLGHNFVNGLRSRGFTCDGSDPLAGFHYRDDGMLLWNALLRFTAGVLHRHYCGSDDAVAVDADLAAWCREMRDESRAAIRSFPERFTSISQLAEAVTTIMFRSSAQHAAVNSSQERYVSYVPNRPNSMLKPMPSDAELHTLGGADLPDKCLRDAMPPMFFGHFQTLFSYVLSTPDDLPLAKYYGLCDLFPLEFATFKAELGEIADAIDARNAKLEAADEPPYEFLNPRTCPTSIAI